MRRLTLFFIMLSTAVASCSRLGEGGPVGSGSLKISFGEEGHMLTRAYINLPDTSDFILKVTSSAGKVFYDGKYGDCPEVLEVDAGSYNIRVVSSEFSKPAFDSPQFGDEQCVVVPEGGCADVNMECSQLNAGLALKIDPEFLSSCPEGVLFLKSSQGRLMYSYNERRMAYFLPGSVSLILVEGTKETLLMTRAMKAEDMLTIRVNVASGRSEVSAADISMSIDTARVWQWADCILGASDKGVASDDALSVSDVLALSEKEDVWVCGYVVGGDLTSASASFSGPFESRTNLLLGPKSTTSDKGACISVQLPSGDVREMLNLVDNPELLGRRVCLKGDVVLAYYGIRGLKNVSEYILL